MEETNLEHEPWRNVFTGSLPLACDHSAFLYFLESFTHSEKHPQWAIPSLSINHQESSSQAWL